MYMCNLFEVRELLVVLKFRILLEKYENKEMLENKNKKKGKFFLHFHFKDDATLFLSLVFCIIILTRVLFPILTTLQVFGLYKAIFHLQPKYTSLRGGRDS